MKTEELLDLYPIATEVVRDWFMDKMAESFKNQELPKDFKEFMREQGIPNDRLVKLIDVNPRVLFDVFDDNSVIINTMCRSGLWSWSVDETKSADFHSSRKLAEKNAVECAFQILDNKLNVTLVEDNDA
jgi:hypothetical protein